MSAHGRLSLRSFVTQGQLASICAELSESFEAVVQLRDEQGLVLSLDPLKLPVDEPTEVGTVWVPIVVENERIGSLTIGPGREGARRDRLERVVRLLGSATEELCRNVNELAHRLREIQVHYTLSDLLVSGGKLDDTLRTALESALELLRLDAGSVVLLPEGADGLSANESEGDLALQASVGMSEGYLQDRTPLSHRRVFDNLALGGEVVTIEDLLNDERVLEPDRCAREGLASFINTGLVFEGQPIGVMRLYGRTARLFNAADRRLIRMIGQQAAAAVEQGRLLKMRSRERQTQRALRVAGQVQKRMLPRRMPELCGLDAAARFQPSHELGGDFYDLFEIDGRLGMVVGDAVGKGVSAALLMSAARAALRAHADQSADICEVIERVNRGLCRDTEVEEFVTIWYATVDPVTHIMTGVSAGHEPTLIARRRNDGEVTIRSLTEPGGLVAGIIETERYEAYRVQLEPGDVVVAYSDGMIDARDYDGRRFGRDRFEQAIVDVVRTDPDGSADFIAGKVLWAVRNHVGLALQADDETLVVLKVE